MQFMDRPQFLLKIENIYLEIEAKIIEILPNARVEHVGSSAISGAISKGDLDIFVGITQDDFLKAIEFIKRIGFNEKLDTLRTDSLCMMTSSTYNEDVAVQLVANGSEHESFLKFRDKLRSNPDLVSRYNQLKRDCKGLSHDNYREVKSAFIETVLKTH
jgi:GrpB-like predicted nucleotidyltransferase (UPF0157 family)